MSWENVDVVRSIYAAWEGGDFTSVEWADPEIEYVQSAAPLCGLPLPQRFRGRDTGRAMSQENVEVVRRAFDASGTRGLQETAQRYWHPEIEYVEDPRWPGASSHKGREAVLRCWQGYTETLGSEEDFTISVERVIDAGERQVPLIRFHSRGSASGIPHEHLWAYVVEVREGRIAYLRAYYEPSEALEAMGLSE